MSDDYGWDDLARAALRMSASTSLLVQSMQSVTQAVMRAFPPWHMREPDTEGWLARPTYERRS